MNIRTTSSAAAAALMVIAGAAHAALVKNGDGTTTDTNTNLVWLQDWDSLGAQSWDRQTAWADNLVFAGSSDWRLPSYDEYFDVSTGSAILAGGFFNVRREHFYWSTTEIADDRVLLIEPVTRDATAITTLNPNFKFHAVAVRPGDVVSPVPEPSTLALALLALGATALKVRRRRAQDSGASGFGLRGFFYGEGTAVASTARPLGQVSCPL